MLTGAVNFFSHARLTWLLVVMIATAAMAVSEPLDMVLQGGYDASWWKVLTYPLVHTSPLHLVVNVLVLLVAGTWCERSLGSTMLIVVFAGGCLCGGLLFMILTLATVGSGWLEGASAGIIAVAVCAVGASNRVWHFGSLAVTPRIINILLLLIILSGIFGNNPGGAAAHIGGWLVGYMAWMIISHRHAIRNLAAHNAAVERMRVSGYSSLNAQQRSQLFHHRDS